MAENKTTRHRRSYEELLEMLDQKDKFANEAIAKFKEKIKVNRAKRKELNKKIAEKNLREATRSSRTHHLIELGAKVESLFGKIEVSDIEKIYRLALVGKVLEEVTNHKFDDDAELEKLKKYFLGESVTNTDAEGKKTSRSMAEHLIWRIKNFY